MQDIIVFGDSHSQCFTDTFTTHYFPASSAKGLANCNSTTNANGTIKRITQGNKTKNYIFFFGKVDMDFILNHMYNKHDDFDVETYINSIVKGYIQFIHSLDLIKVYVCELPIGHVKDKDLLVILNDEFNHKCVGNFLNEKYDKLNFYKKVIPFETRNFFLQYFNAELKALCEKYDYTFLEINKYFTDPHTGLVKVPEKYVHPGPNHHLKHSIKELFINSLQNPVQKTYSMWKPIANQGDQVANVQIGSLVRYGKGNNWIVHTVNEIPFPVTNAYFKDPCNDLDKHLEILITS